MNRASAVKLSADLARVREIVIHASRYTDRIIGTEFNGETLPNGDWCIKLEDFESFDWLNSREPFERVSPLAA